MYLDGYEIAHKIILHQDKYRSTIMVENGIAFISICYMHRNTTLTHHSNMINLKCFYILFGNNTVNYITALSLKNFELTDFLLGRGGGGGGWV